MARWRAEALKRLPELRAAIDAAPDIMSFWIDARLAFARAYEQNPPDNSLIARVYSFADWCAAAPRGADAGHDPSTAVVVAFYEDIPAIPAARADMPRWFRYEEIAANRTVFSYHLTAADFGELLQHMQRNRDLYEPRPQ